MDKRRGSELIDLLAVASEGDGEQTAATVSNIIEETIVCVADSQSDGNLYEDEVFGAAVLGRGSTSAPGGQDKVNRQPQATNQYQNGGDSTTALYEDEDFGAAVLGLGWGPVPGGNAGNSTATSSGLQQGKVLNRQPQATNQCQNEGDSTAALYEDEYFGAAVLGLGWASVQNGTISDANSTTSSSARYTSGLQQDIVLKRQQQATSQYQNGDDSTAALYEEEDFGAAVLTQAWGNQYASRAVATAANATPSDSTAALYEDEDFGAAVLMQARGNQYASRVTNAAVATSPRLLLQATVVEDDTAVGAIYEDEDFGAALLESAQDYSRVSKVGASPVARHVPQTPQQPPIVQNNHATSNNWPNVQLAKNDAGEETYGVVDAVDAAGVCADECMYEDEGSVLSGLVAAQHARSQLPKNTTALDGKAATANSSFKPPSLFLANDDSQSCYGNNTHDDNTSCYGNTENDNASCYGNTENDATSCYGNMDNGSCYGNMDNASCYGNTDNASCYGNTDNASCYGNADNASCYGNVDNVSCHGNMENASCYGNMDTASCYGNTENDTGSCYGNLGSINSCRASFHGNVVDNSASCYGTVPSVSQTNAIYDN